MWQQNQHFNEKRVDKNKIAMNFVVGKCLFHNDNEKTHIADRNMHVTHFVWRRIDWQKQLRPKRNWGKTSKLNHSRHTFDVLWITLDMWNAGKNRYITAWLLAFTYCIKYWFSLLFVGVSERTVWMEKYLIWNSVNFTHQTRNREHFVRWVGFVYGLNGIPSLLSATDKIILLEKSHQLLSMAFFSQSLCYWVTIAHCQTHTTLCVHIHFGCGNRM